FVPVTVTELGHTVGPRTVIEGQPNPGRTLIAAVVAIFPSAARSDEVICRGRIGRVHGHLNRGRSSRGALVIGGDGGERVDAGRGRVPGKAVGRTGDLAEFHSVLEEFDFAHAAVAVRCRGGDGDVGGFGEGRVVGRASESNAGGQVAAATGIGNAHD